MGGMGADDTPSEPRSPPELERQVAAPGGGGAGAADYTTKPFTQWNVSGNMGMLYSFEYHIVI